MVMSSVPAPPPASTPSAFQRAALLLLAGVLLALHLATLLRFPAPFVDEAWAANRAWAFLTTGVAFGVLDAGVFEQFPAHVSYFPVLPTFLQALPLSLVGAPLLWPLRIVSLAFGCVLLFAIYMIGEGAMGRTSALIAVMLTALSTPFAYSAHLARWDIMIAALGYSAVALQVRNRTRRIVPAGAAGLLVGLAFEIHPHAAVFAPVAGGLYLLESGWRTPLRRDVWAWCGGLLAGAGVYWYFHVAGHPESFIALATLAHGPTHTPALATGDPALIADAVRRGVSMIAGVNPFYFLVFLVAFPLTVFSGQTSRRTAWIAGLVVASFTLLVRNRFPYYAVIVTPAMDLVSAAAVVRLAKGGGGLFPRLAAGVLTVGLGLGAVVTLSVARVDGAEVFDRVLKRVVGQVSASDTVIGPQTYWFGLVGHRYLSWEQLVYFRRCHPEATLSEAFQHFRPDILIVDRHLRFFLNDQGQPTAYAGLLSLSAAEFNRYIEKHARILTDFDGEHYGRVTVYRLHTPPAPAVELGACSMRAER
jgi:4-amino-4-deoxy-L-arabinose transferase-like glycosyltransferase